MLSYINKKLKRLVQGSFDYPYFVIVVTFITFTILSLGLKGFKLSLSIDELINPSYKTSKSYFNLKSNFEDGADLLLLRVSNRRSFNVSDICKHRQFFQEQALKRHNVWALYSPFSLRTSSTDTSSISNFKTLNFKELMSINCDTQDRTDSGTLDFKNIINTPWDGIIAKGSGEAFLTKLSFVELDEKNFYGKKVPSIVESIISEFDVKVKNNESNDYWLGQASYQYWVSKGIKYHNILNIGLFLLVTLFLRTFLGTWVSSLYFFLSLIISSAFIYMLISVTSTPIDVLNNSLFLLLTIASLGDFIFISHHSLHSNEHWIESFKSLALPSFFTSLTTFIGFMSLCSSDLEIVKRFGLWAALSGVIEWGSLFVVLPAILNIILKSKKWVDSKKTYFHDLLRKLETIKFPKALIYILFTFYIISLATPYKIVVNDNPNELFPENHSYRKATDALKKSFGFEGKVSLVFNNRDDVEFNKKVINRVKEYRNVVKVEDPYTMVSYLTNKLEKDEAEIVERNLKNSVAYKRLVSEEQVRAVLYLDKTTLKEINEFREFVNDKLCIKLECELTGALVAYADFSQLVPATLISSLFISLFLVFIILLVLAKKNSFKDILTLLISSFWGVSLILTVLIVFQVELNFVTCIVVAILVGMTGDNAIHYLLAGEQLDDGVRLRSGASVMTTLIMSFSCIIFLFYMFKPPQIFGGLLFIGLWGSLMGDLWILNGLRVKK